VHLDDDRLYLLLDRYLAGEASPQDAETVRQWLAADPQHAVLLEDLRLIRRVTAAERAPESSTDEAWARAAGRLAGAASDAPATAVPVKRFRSRPLFVWATVGIAAAVAALLIGPRVWQPRWNDRTTAVGHQAVITLRDGTQLTLGPASHLRYQSDFGRAHRDLYLDGEAYFHFARDTLRPFRVHTAHSVTEDVGTAFVVRAYADQVATEVVVTEGRVALWHADTGSAPRVPPPPALVLDARDLGRLDAGGSAGLRRGVNVDRYLAWTKGVLAFDGAPLGDVVHTLERWYDVHITVGDSVLAGRRLTATFQNEPIDLVVNRIALTLGLRVERANGSVSLVRNRS